MINRVSRDQRRQVLELLSHGEDRHTISALVGVTPGQVSAIAAHVKMGTYGTAGFASELSFVSGLSTNTTETHTMPSPLEIVRPDPPRACVFLGVDSETNEEVFWTPDTEFGSANPHMLILGESGYGKTYATSCLVTELSQRHVPSIIFDYGQGFSTPHMPREFVEWAKPLEIDANRNGVAVNPLEIFPGDVHGPASVAQRVADTFARVYPRLGVQQHAMIRRAVIDVLGNVGITQSDPATWSARAPHFKHVERQLEQYTEQPGLRRGIALSAASHVSTLFVFDTFRSSGHTLSWGDLFREADGAWSLQLKGLEVSVGRAVTEFLLWNLIGFVEAKGPGPLRCFVVLDEAHKLSFAGGSPVEKLLREARKFGLGLILASQQPEDFSSVAFTNTATKIVFQAADERSVVSRQLARKVRNHSFSQIYELITRLPRGSAYVVTENVGRVVKIASFPERVDRWLQRASTS